MRNQKFQSLIRFAVGSYRSTAARWAVEPVTVYNKQYETRVVVIRRSNSYEKIEPVSAPTLYLSRTIPHAGSLVCHTLRSHCDHKCGTFTIRLYLVTNTNCVSSGFRYPNYNISPVKKAVAGESGGIEMPMWN
jgi:hypothetical protein